MYLLNSLIIGPLSFLPLIIFDLKINVGTSLDGIPSRSVFFTQFLFCALVEDLIFHMSHRLLHWKKIYPYIHKMHHQHRVTISIAAIYAHPIEFVFGNIFPSVAGPLILGNNMHIAAVFTFYGIRTIETLEGHSGYEFSWSPLSLIPMGCDSGYHAYHHSHNLGNFSSFFTFWDDLLGSNV